MAQVQSVRGPVDLEALGTTLMHEHVFVLNEEIRQNYPAYWDEERRVADAIEKLRALKAAGVATIVDPTVIGLGRYIPRIQRINAEVDINIITATGLYTYNELPYFFQFRGTKARGTGDSMAEFFVRDIVEGIADTTVKAAFLKCAIDAGGMTRGVERVMRAVAAAHRETNVPIVVHTSVANRSGLLVQELMAAEGVDPLRLVIGHSGDSTDLEYLLRMIDAGSYLGMDRFGMDALLSFDARVETVAELCRRGYAERLVLSHDAACYIDWFPEAAKNALGPKWHYTHILDDVLPALRERGVTAEQIATMLVENPRRFFSRP